ncbi:MAG: CRISPR-associated RAMP protein Csx7 [Thermoproteota archaeon]
MEEDHRGRGDQGGRGEGLELANHSYPPWVSHSVLLRQARISCRLRTLEPLRVGMGRVDTPDATTDMPVIRIKMLREGLDIPYIPGSSMKGIFRSAAESIAKSQGIKPDPCSGLSKNSCMDLKRFEGRRLSELVEEHLKSNQLQEAIKIFADSACLLCKVFGAPSYKSKVFFEDAYPVNANGRLTDVPTGIKMGIAIDRSTGAVAAGALYRIEYIEPGALFSFSLNATNLPNYAVGLLAEVFTLLDEGMIRVGGFKSRGFGRMKIEDLSMSIKHHSPVSGSADRLDTLGDSNDKVIFVKPSEVVDDWIIYRGSELTTLLNELRMVWREYAASTRKS